MPRELGRRGAGTRDASTLGVIRIGCSGWQYAHWRGTFYPADAPTASWLERYATVFDTVEINASFYKLPERRCAHAWGTRVPSDFLFAWKASRFLTHMKKLKDPDEPIRRMLASARGLGKKLGPVLFQLPPHWAKDTQRLADFVHALPRSGRWVFEFREPSWYADDVLDLLARANAALCLHDMPGSEPPRVQTAPFVYVRFHGASGRYRGGYDAAALRPWVRWLAARADAGADVFAYFNNDAETHAPRDAVRLRRLLERRAAAA